MSNYLTEFNDAFGQLMLLWMRKLREICEQENVTPTEKRLLYALARYGKLTKKELAKAVILEHSSVSRALDSLEQRDFVERVVSDTDRRYIQLTITDSGSAKVKAIKILALQHLKKMAHDLPADEFKQATTLIKKLLENDSC